MPDLELHTEAYWNATFEALNAPSQDARAVSVRFIAWLASFSPHRGVRSAARHWMEVYIGGGYVVLPVAKAEGR